MTTENEGNRQSGSSGLKLKTFSFGGCDFGATSPPLDQLSATTAMLNLTVSFEEALQLHLAMGECIRKLNTYKRSTKAGRQQSMNIAIHLGKGRTGVGRITINETKRNASSRKKHNQSPA